MAPTIEEVLGRATKIVDPKATPPTKDELFGWMHGHAPDADKASLDACIAIRDCAIKHARFSGNFQSVAMTPPFNEDAEYDPSYDPMRLCTIYTFKDDDPDDIHPHPLGIVGVHGIWRDVAETLAEGEPEPPHPIVILVQGWLRRPRKGKFELERVNGIAPESFRTARVRIISEQGPDDRLIAVGLQGRASTTEQSQGDLFNVDTRDLETVPELPIDVGFVQAGGLMRSKGRGVPPHRRFFWFPIINTSRAERIGDCEWRFSITPRNLMKIWVQPGTETTPSLRKLRPAPAAVGGGREPIWRWLRREMIITNNLLVRWERLDWVIVHYRNLPTHETRLDDELLIAISLPPGSENGPMIDKNVMYELGATSSPAFDAGLRLTYIWDKAKKDNGSRRIYATRNKVLRDDQAFLIDCAGKRITGPDPDRARRKKKWVSHDQPTKNWNDSRAIVLGTERNPAADRVPELDRHNIVRLAYGNHPPQAKERDQVKKAMDAIRKHLVNPGHVVMEEQYRRGDSNGTLSSVRILQPQPDPKSD